MGSMSVFKCESCGLEIDAAKVADAMGFGGYRKVFIPVSKCFRCGSTKIHVQHFEWKWWEFWKVRF